MLRKVQAALVAIVASVGTACVPDPGGGGTSTTITQVSTTTTTSTSSSTTSSTSTTSTTTVPVGCVAGSPLTVPTTIDKAVFLYEQIGQLSDAELQSMIESAKWVVVSRQGSAELECQAARRISALGAVPVRYVQWVWFSRTGNSFLADHPEWEFCAPGYTTSATGSGSPTGGGTRAYPDLNILAARQAVNDELAELKAAGYQGLFFDIGGRVYRDGAPSDQGPIASTVNSCSGSQPLINPARTFSESQLAVMRHARTTLGFVTIMNCCTRSALVDSPAIAGDVARGASENADYLLTEEMKLAAQPRDASVAPGSLLQLVGADNESSGTVISYQCAESAGDALFSWARAKLWDEPVVINTGVSLDPADGGCADGFNRFGVFPNLVTYNLGSPLDTAPRRGQCEPGSTTACTWSRRYRNGSVYINTSDSHTLRDYADGEQPVQFSNSRTCPNGERGAFVAKMSATSDPQPLADVSCHNVDPRSPGPLTATVLIYSNTPW